MRPPMKYQPYHGYGCAHPFLWYFASESRRVRTRSDWRYPRPAPVCDITHQARGRYAVERCPGCGHVHCRVCGCDQPWKRPAKSSKHSVFEKRLTHRLFRRMARNAIARELRDPGGAGAAVSHAFIVSGDYLD